VPVYDRRVPTTGGILLAGGASRRLPPNKLLEPIAGEPLFWRALRALASSCDHVVVMVGAGQPDLGLPLLGVPVRVARDRDAAGPLAAVADGLELATADVVLVAAGDTPEIPSRLLVAMRDALRETESDALVLRDGGSLRPIPLALRSARCAPVARGLVARGILRLGVLVEYGDLAVDARDESWWSAFDPTGAWRRDVDEPADLSRARGDARGPR
jgi:molybdopterin-guanine dinucleotide biosynthesis protein A